MRKLIALSLMLLICSCKDTSFEDCILENAKEAKTAEAALMIRKACLDKFPEMARVCDKAGTSCEMVPFNEFKPYTESYN